MEKKNIDREAEDSHKRLKEYMDYNIDKMSEHMKIGRSRTSILYIAIGIQVFTAFIIPIKLISFLAVIVVWTLVGNNIYHYFKISRYNSQLTGCFDTLRILGLMREEPPESGKKKKDSKVPAMWQSFKERLFSKRYNGV